MKYIKKSILFTFIALVLFSCNKKSDGLEGLINEEQPIETILPHVYINTNGAQIVDEPKVNAEITILVGDEIDYTGAIGIEIRGSSSQSFPKKQFGFETRDVANEDINVSLLGFPEEEDWILYAPYSDKSLIRNMLMYDLSRDIGRYASRSKFVNVTINDEYNGVYLLLEKLKRDGNRIDINKLKEDENSGDDLTGGYILKIDKAGGSNEMLYTDYNSITSAYSPNYAIDGQKIHFVYDTPDEDDITSEQSEYISNYMASFEDALASTDFADPDKGYNAFIDTQSFIEFFLLNELSNNVDGYRLSTWLTKDKNEKLKMGPIWDFNLAFGNADYCGGGDTTGWTYKFNERCPGDFWQIPFWWSRLLEDPAFVLQVKERWLALRSNEFSNLVITQKINSYIATLSSSDAIEENFVKWPVLGEYVWPNNFVGTTYEEEKNYLMNWINNRLSWLDNQISAL